MTTQSRLSRDLDLLLDRLLDLLRLGGNTHQICYHTIRESHQSI